MHYSPPPLRPSQPARESNVGKEIYPKTLEKFFSPPSLALSSRLLRRGCLAAPSPSFAAHKGTNCPTSSSCPPPFTRRMASAKWVSLVLPNVLPL